MQNTKNPLLSALIAAAFIVTVLSTTLTMQFFYADGDTVASYVLAGMGIILDCVKVLAPMIAIYMFIRGNHFLALFTSAIAVMLCVVSFVASVSALEKNVLKPSQTVEATVIENQIGRLEGLYESHMATYNRRIEIDHLKEGDKSLQAAKKVTEQIQELYKQKEALSENETTSKFENEISIGIAGIIELVTIMLSVAISIIQKDSNEVRKLADKPSKEEDSGDTSNALLADLHERMVNYQQQLTDLSNQISDVTMSQNRSSDNVNPEIELTQNENSLDKQEAEVLVEIKTERQSDNAVESMDNTETQSKPDSQKVTTKDNVVTPTFKKAIASSNMADESKIYDSCSSEGELVEETLVEAQNKSARSKLISEKHKKIVQSIRVKTASGELNPSVRGVDSITSNRRLIRETFEGMVLEGILERTNNGYKLIKVVHLAA
ncbi:hypothetical protein [Vibrio sp. D431a]|uniref:hypothetical protein n=1 Tax=Vibrio sp. D431a TaxID=2837388 RepID=UPI0025568A8D|nr:hypothetical protein [Vibrio sp. D431a]MDK9790676.1 hypothetical protein [Vibrio sp. D431a]